MAFIFDWFIIFLISILVYLGYDAIREKAGGEAGLISRVSQAIKAGEHVSIRMSENESADLSVKSKFLKILEERVTAEEFEAAKRKSSEEIYHEYEAEFIAAGYRHRFIYLEESFNLLKEYVISLLYFVLFFRFGGRTPGKRIFRLKVLDLEGKPRLEWYQSFERAHGYVCSGLFASLGFWQVLWNKRGLTMHDKIAETTVIKLPKKKRPKRKKKAKRISKKLAEAVEE
jgi:hypothetical protein